MTTLFITIGLMDIVDILLVSFLLYQIYLLIRGTAALNIFVGIFLFYLAWLMVKAFNMQLMSSILGQFIGVGVLALIIVFQQEIRRMFLMLGTRYKITQGFSFENLFLRREQQVTQEHVKTIVRACENMIRTHTGALIVLARENELSDYTQTGETINAQISEALLETIFFKNSPLHDGAVIIVGSKVVAARCILPVTERRVDAKLGLRHRAAIGVSEDSDAQVIVVSEERGSVSYVSEGKVKKDVSLIRLTQLIEAGLVVSEKGTKLP